MTAAPLLVERRGGVRRLVLDRPHRRNAIDPTLLPGAVADADPSSFLAWAARCRTAIERMPQPVVAAVHRHAAGALTLRLALTGERVPVEGLLGLAAQR